MHSIYGKSLNSITCSGSMGIISAHGTPFYCNAKVLFILEIQITKTQYIIIKSLVLLKDYRPIR